MSKKVRFPDLEKYLEQGVKQINIFLMVFYVAGIAAVLIIADWTSEILPSFSDGITASAIMATEYLVPFTLIVVIIPIGAIFLRVLLEFMYFGSDALQMVIEYRKERKEDE